MTPEDAKVIRLIRKAGEEGQTVEWVAEQLSMQPNAVKARIMTLKRSKVQIPDLKSVPEIQPQAEAERLQKKPNSGQA